jgi:hypothetical protein
VRVIVAATINTVRRELLMKHVDTITRQSMPQLAAPPVLTSKDGCKANLSGGEALGCKSAIKKDGSYPL